MMIEEPSQDPSAPSSVWQLMELTHGAQLRREGMACITAWPVMLTSAGAGHPGFGRSASTEVKRFDTCSRSKSTSSAAPSFRHVAGAIAGVWNAASVAAGLNS